MNQPDWTGARGIELKRAFDFSLALLGLALSAPLWLVAALAIYGEDRGPVFFLQERCGKGGALFRTIKFRTMKQPKEGEAHLDLDLEHDPRVTKVGRLLRVTALDELPELLNILRGEMSFVGPRPLAYRIDDEEKCLYGNITDVPGYGLRSQVRPGLTGLAQVYAPKDTDRRNKFRYDGLYVRRHSFWLDLKLVLVSFWITFTGRWEKLGKKVQERPR
jgi:lipopolysaccharide/colanic/teichoic acid biosynthesis glycosyltransferase